MRPEDSQQNTSRCLCPTCPTYNDCMRGNGERLFCGRGKTGCNPHANGCLCGECPVWDDYGLADYYFCREGAAS